MTDPNALPYRANVGAVLFGPDGRVLLARRHDTRKRGEEIWQFPQGGIDAGEVPRDAVLRELGEEIGTRDCTVLSEHPDWLSYDFPPHLMGRALGGRYRGQRQRWFALRFDGSDDAIRLDAHREVEFDQWRWVELAAVPTLPVGFKAPIYRVLADSFARFAGPDGDRSGAPPPPT